MTDPFTTYPPRQLYAQGARLSNMTVEDAVEEYLEYHPDADAHAVRAEIRERYPDAE
jgi:ribosomal 50S subunit-associated protein YjgA (DUF615 family)